MTLRNIIGEENLAASKPRPEGAQAPGASGHKPGPLTRRSPRGCLMRETSGFWPAAVLALLVPPGCSVAPPPQGGEETRDKVVIERSRAMGAERITAEIHIGAGELRLSGGARELLEAQFEYNVAALKPQVRFEGTGFRRLLITQGGAGAIGGIVNRWDIRLGGDVPLDLVVRCGAGENRLDLREAPVRSLELDLGVGEAAVDLRRAWDHDVDAKIKGGIGRAVVLVPAQGGVEARASGGIGEIHVIGLRREDGRWVSEGDSRARTRLRLEVAGGIGQIEIRAE